MESIQKLYHIEIVDEEHIETRPSRFLMSFSREKQIGILTSHLLTMKEDLRLLSIPGYAEQSRDYFDDDGDRFKVNKTQLEINISVTESLIRQIQQKMRND